MLCYEPILHAGKTKETREEKKKKKERRQGGTEITKLEQG